MVISTYPLPQWVSLVFIPDNFCYCVLSFSSLSLLFRVNTSPLLQKGVTTPCDGPLCAYNSTPSGAHLDGSYALLLGVSELKISGVGITCS